MKTSKWLLCLLITALSCTKSNPDPSPGLNDTVTAFLNDQVWSGRVTARTPSLESEPCGVNTFNLSIENSLPYPKRARLQAPSYCVGYCGDQSFGFTRVPLAVGVYAVSTPGPCQTGANKVGVSYVTLIGGDVLRDQYLPRAVQAGTITITKYDSRLGEIEGTFDVTLVRDTSRPNRYDAAETVHFRNESFRVRLP